MKRGKAELKRAANALMAGCLRGALEAGSISSYQEQNSLSDQEAEEITSAIWDEIVRLEGKSLSPTQKGSI